MVLFEDFNQDYITVYQGVGRLLDAELTRTGNVDVGKALAEASLSLHHLSVSFIIDASDFFRARQSTWVWNELVTLVLTSRLLSPDENHAGINDLLKAAAAAAAAMPRLVSMELWNGAKGQACVFRYQAPEGCQRAKITWRGTWDLPLEPCVIQSWGAVACKRVQCEF